MTTTNLKFKINKVQMEHEKNPKHSHPKNLSILKYTVFFVSICWNQFPRLRNKIVISMRLYLVSNEYLILRMDLKRSTSIDESKI